MKEKQFGGSSSGVLVGSTIVTVMVVVAAIASAEYTDVKYGRSAVRAAITNELVAKGYATVEVHHLTTFAEPYRSGIVSPRGCLRVTYTDPVAGTQEGYYFDKSFGFLKERDKVYFTDIPTCKR